MKKSIYIFIMIIILCLICCSSQADRIVIGDDIYIYEILDDNTIMITQFIDQGDPTTDLVFPSEIDEKPITKFGPQIFPILYSPFTITLPKYLKEIEENTFTYGVSDIKKIIIPEEYCITDSFFYQFRNLTEFEVLGDNSDYATIDGVLYRKSDKRLVSYPTGREEKTFEIPNGINIIGQNAFSYNDSLKSVIIPETVQSIEDNAFHYCSNLMHAKLPVSLKYLGSYAFSDTAINEYILGPNLTEMGKNPFSKLFPHFSITVDENNPRYFMQDKNLIDRKLYTLIAYEGGFDSNYSIPDNIKIIGSNAFKGTWIKNITIPTGVEIIDDYAFSLSVNIEAINIPDTVKHIGTSAIDSYSIKSLMIPASVEYIGSNAFSHSTTLNVYHNSYAEQYAKDNGYYMTYVDESAEKNDEISWLNDD